MRYFIVYYKYYFPDSKEHNYALFCLKSEIYPNASKIVSDIKYIISNHNELIKDNIFLGIYNIQELSEQDYNDFIA